VGSREILSSGSVQLKKRAAIRFIDGVGEQIGEQIEAQSLIPYHDSSVFWAVDVRNKPM
jgi:hypothetical protein